jgi:hypothetical protein
MKQPTFIVVCIPQHGLHLPIMSKGKVQEFVTELDAEETAAFMRRVNPGSQYEVRPKFNQREEH